MRIEFDEDKFKAFRRRAQGKYFVGDEVGKKSTYVHVIKVTEHVDPYGFEDTPDYECIANVFCGGGYGLFNERGFWWISDERLKYFHYKKISKSEFIRRVKLDCHVDYGRFQNCVEEKTNSKTPKSSQIIDKYGFQTVPEENPGNDVYRE